MGTSVRSEEAARILGVSRATLYAYVSRGVVARRTAVDGRTSLFDRDELEALARRGRSRTAPPRPSIDVQIVTSVTQLGDDDVRYRGHALADLARHCEFEQVAELLWSGTLPASAPVWDDPDVDVATSTRRVLAAAPGDLDPLARLALATTAISTSRRSDDPATAAQRLITLAPLVAGRGSPSAGRPAGSGSSTAVRLAEAWHPEPSDALVAAIRRALVVLADHELATSTLAVRVAGSVRADPYGAFAAGLAVLRSPLHGSASEAVHDVLVRCERHGVGLSIRELIGAGGRLPGFGHSIYRGEDPRFAPLLEVVRGLDDPSGRLGLVDQVLDQAGRSVTVRPNVDFALGALGFVAGLDPDVPLFAIARFAGWAAHLDEELRERPLRFRGVARPTAG